MVFWDGPESADEDASDVDSSGNVDGLINDAEEGEAEAEEDSGEGSGEEGSDAGRIEDASDADDAVDLNRIINDSANRGAGCVVPDQLAFG